MPGMPRSYVDIEMSGEEGGIGNISKIWSRKVSFLANVKNQKI